MTDRQLSDEELITGSIQEDLKNAERNGSQKDIEYVLEQYETEKILTYENDHYYRIPIYEQGDPEIAIIYSNWDVDVKTFNDFIRDVGSNFRNSPSYEDILDRDLTAEIEEDIYTQGGIIYHATTVEKAVDILNDGKLEPRNETRGITNRSTGSAVFASELQPDKTYYGDVVFEINLDKMKDNGFRPPLGKELPVEEAIHKEAVAQKFNMFEYRAELDQSISRQTVVIYEEIPIEYVSVNVDDSTAEELREQIPEIIATEVEL